jgi:hypothetical protein
MPVPSTRNAQPYLYRSEGVRETVNQQLRTANNDLYLLPISSEIVVAIERN